MRLLWCALFLQVAFSDIAPAAPLSHAIQQLVQSSDLIVVATIQADLWDTSGSRCIGNHPSHVYSGGATARIQIEKVLRGGSPENHTPLIEIRIPSVTNCSSSNLTSPGRTIINEQIFVTTKAPDPIRSGTMHPLSEGSKWIIFLQDRKANPELGQATSGNEEVRYIAFDPFLSMFPYSQALEMELQKP